MLPLDTPCQPYSPHHPCWTSACTQQPLVSCPPSSSHTALSLRVLRETSWAKTTGCLYACVCIANNIGKLCNCLFRIQIPQNGQFFEPPLAHCTVLARRGDPGAGPCLQAMVAANTQMHPFRRWTLLSKHRTVALLFLPVVSPSLAFFSISSSHCYAHSRTISACTAHPRCKMLCSGRLPRFHA